jgi:hypothetical protein
MMNQAELDERGIVISCPNCKRRNRLAYATLNQQFVGALVHWKLF